jgi:hypothetical protein
MKFLVFAVFVWYNGITGADYHHNGMVLGFHGGNHGSGQGQHGRYGAIGRNR